MRAFGDPVDHLVEAAGAASVVGLRFGDDPLALVIVHLETRRNHGTELLVFEAAADVDCVRHLARLLCEAADAAEADLTRYLAGER